MCEEETPIDLVGAGPGVQPISSNTRSSQPTKTVRFSPSVGVAKIPITEQNRKKFLLETHVQIQDNV